MLPKGAKRARDSLKPKTQELTDVAPAHRQAELAAPVDARVGQEGRRFLRRGLRTDRSQLRLRGPKLHAELT